VSQQTADALIARGKKSWITPGEDKIRAKGKGILQTYFVDLSSKIKSVTSSYTRSLESSETTDRLGDHTSRDLHIIEDDGPMETYMEV